MVLRLLKRVVGAIKTTPVAQAVKPAGPVPFVDRPDALAEVLPKLKPHARIAVDTEADSLHCYFEKLCLIQVSVPGDNWLIDPLASMPLEPLFAAWADKEIIFHGADYDLRLMRRIGYGGPARIFDTMIAARLCGVAEFSLAALLKRHFGLEIPKASQKANWARRPLPPAMLAYAVNDTRHLHELAEIYEKQLRKLGRWTWFEQSCERAIRVTETSKERDGEDAWRITGSGKLRGRAAALVREIWRWRDAEAREADKPSFHILHNQQIIDTAVALDQGGTATFKHLRGGRLRRFEEAVARGLALPESEWPQPIKGESRPRITRAQESQMSSLRAKRDALAKKLQLDPALIAPKAMIEGLVLRPEETRTQMLAWQRELLGV
jgi:ribonuclease D